MTSVTMNLRQIDAFHAVMRCASMSGAARILNISQPNVSRLIAQLEASTRLKLFERRGGRIYPTEDGNALFREVERSQIALQGLTKAAEDILNFHQARLRIATFPAFSLGFLPRILGRFKPRYPAATVSLQVRSSSAILQWAAAEQFDVGITADVENIPNLEAEPLMEIEGACILPAKHRLAARRQIKTEDLKGEDFISLTMDDPGRHRIDALFDKAGVHRVLSIETQYSATICALVAEGLGVSIVNPIIAADFVRRGIVIRPFLPTVTFRCQTLVPKDRPKSRLTVAFLEIAKEFCKQEMVRVAELSKASTAKAKSRK
jgi:DNA-binding transcriptional LysR family regulator